MTFNKLSWPKNKKWYLVIGYLMEPRTNHPTGAISAT